jgi:hypothetical protein
LCSIGFKPKNDKPNVDSSEDCEQIVRTPCTQGQKVDLTGKCVSAAEERKQCEKQCPGSSGKFVEGTGLCQCDQITDAAEVCDAKCMKAMPRSSLDPNGMMTITDPITKKSSTIDPSSMPGYFGSFKCETTNIEATSCNVQSMG